MRHGGGGGGEGIIIVGAAILCFPCAVIYCILWAFARCIVGIGQIIEWCCNPCCKLLLTICCPCLSILSYFDQNDSICPCGIGGVRYDRKEHCKCNCCCIGCGNKCQDCLKDRFVTNNANYAVPSKLTSNWDEYRRMLYNVGWETNVDSVEIIKTDRHYYSVLNAIYRQTNNRPSRIRNRKQFIEALTKENVYTKKTKTFVDKYCPDYVTIKVSNKDESKDLMPDIAESYRSINKSE